MSENSAKIYFKSFAWFDPSIKSYFLMGFLSGFVEITSCVYTKLTIILFNLGE